MMRSMLLILVLTIASAAIWTVLVFLGTSNGWFRDSLADTDDYQMFTQSVVKEIEANVNGNVAFALIEDGRLVSEHFTSIGDAVDRDTMFQVASMSKWITAYGVMVLVEQQEVDLDAPVSDYLTRWQLPPTAYDNDGVTVRRLLSHTAGLTDGLGYLGFEPGEAVQTIEQALERPNATKGPGVKIQLGMEPGTEFEYSGGGYLILQLLIEEVSGMTFEAFMQHKVFEPLGMTRSTYAAPDEGSVNVAISYNVDGTPGVLYNFTAVAASGLYTTTSDMVRFINAHQSTGSALNPLSPRILSQMRQPHGIESGFEVWGLGTMLYTASENDYVIGHDGQNEPAINTSARFNPITGDGYVMLQTGNRILATKIGAEWVFWQSGRIDFINFTSVIQNMLKSMAVGVGVIVICGGLMGWRVRRRATHIKRSTGLLVNS